MDGSRMTLGQEGPLNALTVCDYAVVGSKSSNWIEIDWLSVLEHLEQKSAVEMGIGTEDMVAPNITPCWLPYSFENHVLSTSVESFTTFIVELPPPAPKKPKKTSGVQPKMITKLFHYANRNFGRHRLVPTLRSIDVNKRRYHADKTTETHQAFIYPTS